MPDTNALKKIQELAKLYAKYGMGPKEYPPYKPNPRALEDHREAYLLENTPPGLARPELAVLEHMRNNPDVTQSEVPDEYIKPAQGPRSLWDLVRNRK